MLAYTIVVYGLLGVFFHVAIYNRGKHRLSKPTLQMFLTVVTAIWFTPEIMIDDKTLMPAWTAWAIKDRVPSVFSFSVFSGLIYFGWKLWGRLLPEYKRTNTEQCAKPDNFLIDGQ